METLQEKNKLRTQGAEFVEREMKRFMEKIVSGRFVPEHVTNTEPTMHACYARLPAAYKQLHMDTWSSPRGQEIIDSAPTQMYQWNFATGWCVSEHPSVSILFIWYDQFAQVIGLAGPTKPAVLSFADSENRLYSSRTLYTDAEVSEFNDKAVENVVYLQDFVHP